MRKLSEEFMYELKEGVLKKLLGRVKADDTLNLEIREDTINIYYRGGNLLKLWPKASYSNFNLFFDSNYFKDQSDEAPPLPVELGSSQEVTALLDCIPLLKQGMDYYFAKIKSNDERESGQLFIREHNKGVSAKSTDYFMCDSEYGIGNNCKIDLMAVKWLSSSASRKNGSNLGLAFIEMKYGGGALTGKSGIQDHVNDMHDFLQAPGKLDECKEEMKNIFNQKHELGLINNKNKIESFGNQKPEFIFGMVTHDPASSVFYNVLNNLEIPADFGAEIKVATASFLGFGLFQENIYTLEEFQQRFETQIHNK